MRLVVARQRCSEAGSPSRLMVKHSSRPSRKLAAAAGQSRSNHWANFSSLALPVFPTARRPASPPAPGRSGSGNRSRTLRTCGRGSAAPAARPRTRRGSPPARPSSRWITNSRFWAGCTPRRTKPSSKSLACAQRDGRQTPSRRCRDRDFGSTDLTRLRHVSRLTVERDTPTVVRHLRQRFAPQVPGPRMAAGRGWPPEPWPVHGQLSLLQAPVPAGAHTSLPHGAAGPDGVDRPISEVDG